jgi:hypothetical protein
MRTESDFEALNEKLIPKDYLKKKDPIPYE